MVNFNTLLHESECEFTKLLYGHNQSTKFIQNAAILVGLLALQHSWHNIQLAVHLELKTVLEHHTEIHPF